LFLPQLVKPRIVSEPLYGQPTHNEQLTSSQNNFFEPIPFETPADQATPNRIGTYLS
jgi:hypothetical protein